MSIWTPGGEHNVPEDANGGAQASAAAEQPELTPEQQQQAEEMAKQLSEAREQILGANVRDVIANHAIGLYELAAIHLTAEKPDLASTKVAVDALTTLVEGMEGQLGQAEPTLKESLHNIRLGFVQRSQEAETTPSEE